MPKVALQTIAPSLAAFISDELNFDYSVNAKCTGRNVTLKRRDQTCTVKFKEVIAHLDQLSKGERDVKKMRKALEKGFFILMQGTKDLKKRQKKMSLLQKIQVALHRFFGNLGHRSHEDALRLIEDKYAPMPKLSREGKKILADLKIILKNEPHRLIFKVINKAAKGEKIDEREDGRVEAYCKKVKESQAVIDLVAMCQSEQKRVEGHAIIRKLEKISPEFSLCLLFPLAEIDGFDWETIRSNLFRKMVISAV